MSERDYERVALVIGGAANNQLATEEDGQRLFDRNILYAPDYVINGGKMWTTNGTQADWMCLLANTGEGAVHKNKSLIVVPMKAKGVSVAKKLKKPLVRLAGRTLIEHALAAFDCVALVEEIVMKGRADLAEEVGIPAWKRILFGKVMTSPAATGIARKAAAAVRTAAPQMR